MTRRALALFVVACVAVACSANEAEPTKGTYTILFPSTAAAVATDFVQVLVFDIPDPSKRDEVCQTLIRQRITDPAQLRPSVDPPAPAANICEMHAGRKPVVVPYGEHALLAVAQRKDEKDQVKDFLIGCALMTVGDGDAPLPIPLRLISLNQPVPLTTCGSVGEYCADKCH
jgi:hypothetical protein